MVTPLLGSSRPIVGKKNMFKKGQKNLNYSNISDAPRGKLPLYEKEVEFYVACGYSDLGRHLCLLMFKISLH